MAVMSQTMGYNDMKQVATFYTQLSELISSSFNTFLHNVFQKPLASAIQVPPSCNLYCIAINNQLVHLKTVWGQPHHMFAMQHSQIEN